MEQLRDLVLDKAVPVHHLRVYVSGGGAEQEFTSGEPAEDTIKKLRHLADLLEISVQNRLNNME